jgi:hypothetical protein
MKGHGVRGVHSLTTIKSTGETVVAPAGRARDDGPNVAGCVKGAYVLTMRGTFTR